MKYTVIGCGGWGYRIAERLHDMGVRLAVVEENPATIDAVRKKLPEAQWSFDPTGYLAVTGTQTNTGMGGAVVIATPPETHLELVRAVLNGYGRPPVMLRIEKPLASSVEDAEEIVRLCQEAGTKLTVGFTLLHDPLYEAAFGFLRMVNAQGIRVYSARMGKRARHRCDALLDQGIHGAAIGAYLGVPATVVAAHNDSARIRRTEFSFEGFPDDARVMVDELAGTVDTTAGPLDIDAGGKDALDRDLDAWIEGTHRGTPAVALQAQRIIAGELDRIAEAA